MVLRQMLVANSVYIMYKQLDLGEMHSSLSCSSFWKQHIIEKANCLTENHFLRCSCCPCAIRMKVDKT